MIYHKDIIWEEVVSGNIATRLGRIEGTLMFTMCRFSNPAFPDENWVVTSSVVPIGMIKGKNIPRLEADVNLVLDTFLLKILESPI